MFALPPSGKRFPSENCFTTYPWHPDEGPGKEVLYDERNQELSLIRDEMISMNHPAILVGDLNCGLWSPAFRHLVDAGLHDSEQGFGPQPSWPARNGRVIENVPIPPLVPIDHVLVSNDVCVLQRVTGPPMQSDHLPVFVRVAIRN
jgi:endonuclease/exonuclease/phosphatase (EEP) superfamily protein YafD